MRVRFLITFIFMAILSLKVSAQLDNSYGENGLVINGLGIANADIQSITIDTKDRILTTSNAKWWTTNYSQVIISRYFSDGKVDSTFGIDGNKNLTFTNVDNNGSIIKSDTRNRYLIAGGSYDGAYIARLTEDGHLDTDFNKKGYLFLNSLFEEPIPLNSILDMYIYEDNSIGLIVGAEASSFWPPIDKRAKMLMKIKEDGNIDTSFGDQGGIYTILRDMDSYNGYINRADMGAAYDKDGNSYVTLNEDYLNDSPGILMKRFPNGEIDSSFAKDGRAFIDSIVKPGIYEIDIQSIHVDENKNIFLFKENEVIKLNSDGQLDTLWGDGGYIHEDDENDKLTNKGIVFSHDNMIIYGYIEGDEFMQYTINTRWYDKNGHLIDSIGTDGLVLSDLTDYEQIVNHAISLNDGSIILGGHVSQYDKRGYEMTLLKYTPKGEKDITFGNQGVGKYITLSNSTLFQSYISMSDGSLIISGITQNGINYNNGFIIKHLPSGTVDSSFADKGKIYLPDRSELAEYNLIGEIDHLSFLALVLNRETGYKRVIRKILADGTFDKNWANQEGWIKLDENKTYLNYQVVDDKFLNIVSLIDSNTLLLEQYLSDGTLNTSFGNNGKLSIYLPGNGVLTPDQIAYEDGYILLLGKIPQYSDKTLLRIKPNGEIDNTFGTNGYIRFAETSNYFKRGINKDLYVLSFGDINKVRKFSTGGLPDLSYGLNGEYRISEILDHPIQIDRILPQQDGSLLMGFEYTMPDVSYGYLGFLKLDAFGKLDENFGSNGIVTDPTLLRLSNFRFFNNRKDGSLMTVGSRNWQSDLKYFIQKWDYSATILGIKQHYNDSKNVSLYPNPAKDQISIQFQTPVQIKNVQIFNLSGKLIHVFTLSNKTLSTSSQILSINIPNDIASGAYILHINSNKGSFSKKWLKQ
ncbi:MAG: T9SS type A sorting domain-containing protein [Chitinophagales bacterium]|nr:T9SS type A sorting domain-containing protein [Chitinophagales bacterium]